MKIFLDSADIDEIKEVMTWGVADGVTTNPSLIKKAQEKHKVKDMDAYIKTLCKAVGKGKDLSLEVIGTDYKTMTEQGLTLYKKYNKIANNVIIKVPINPSTKDEPNSDGLKAISTLAKKGIGLNVTLCFTPEQSWLAAKAGAKYVSPFVGRIDDDLRKKANIEFEKTDYFPALGWKKDGHFLEDNGILSGIDLVKQTRLLFDNFNIKSEIIAASLRNSRQVREAALVGAHVGTIPFQALTNTLIHHKTSEGMVNFINDVVPEYEKVFK